MSRRLSIVKEADIHLYRIGLCLTTNRTDINRIFIHKPIVQTVVLIYGLFKYTITLLVPELDLFVSIVLGDFSQFLGIKLHFNIACNLFIILGLCSQSVYFYNYMNEINPTFLTVFEIMSGLGERKDITVNKRLTRRTKLLISLVKFNNEKIIPIVMMALMIPYFSKCNSVFVFVLIAIPNAVLNIMIAYYAYNLMAYQVTYFYLICYYLKSKIKSINDKLPKSIQLKSFATILPFIHRFNRICVEMNEYNNYFWYKFLLIFWSTIGCFIAIFMYFVLFSPLSLILRMAITYAMIIPLSVFLFIIFTASSLNSEANKLQKLLIPLVIPNYKPYGQSSVK